MIYNRFRKLWRRLTSGILVPDGYASGRAGSDRDSYLEVKSKAKQLEALYAQMGLHIPARCGLALLIQSAKELSDGWIVDGARRVSDETLFRAAHLNSLATAVLAIRDDPGAAAHLARLTSGRWDLLDSQQAPAKDFLWELELLHTLKRNGADARLAEPPDIVVTVDGAEIGIACKRIYSEKNLEKVLSIGVNQTERQHDYGLVAFNLDSMFRPGELHAFANEAQMRQAIDGFNLEFMRRHEKHLRNYLATGRALAALVSTGVLVDVQDQPVRLNTARWSTFWTIPDMPDDKKAAFQKLRTAIGA